MKVSQGGSFATGASGCKEDVRVFLLPLSVKSSNKFKQFKFNSKFWGIKPKAATKVTLQQPTTKKFYQHLSL